MEEMQEGKTQSLDDDLEQILGEENESKEPEVKTATAPKVVYKRKVLESKQPEIPAPKETLAKPEVTETKEELRKRLKDKMHNTRQQKIQDRRKKTKNPSFPLTPIFFCDTQGCLSIMNNDDAKTCPVCRCFFYCSKDCQTKDWSKHKLMCGKNPDDHHKEKLELYKKARDAAQAIFEKTKDGNYLTVLHETGEVVAAIFTTIAEKSNLLNWRKYIENPIFTTAETTNLAQLSFKLSSAIQSYPDSKIYLISVILDRLREGGSTECVVRLFVADRYGETMNAGNNGQITKTAVKYVRKAH